MSRANTHAWKNDRRIDLSCTSVECGSDPKAVPDKYASFAVATARNLSSLRQRLRRPDGTSLFNLMDRVKRVAARRRDPLLQGRSEISAFSPEDYIIIHYCITTEWRWRVGDENILLVVTGVLLKYISNT